MSMRSRYFWAAVAIAAAFYAGRLTVNLVSRADSPYEIKTWAGILVRVDKRDGTFEPLKLKPPIGIDFQPEKRGSAQTFLDAKPARSKAFDPDKYLASRPGTKSEFDEIVLPSASPTH